MTAWSSFESRDAVVQPTQERNTTAMSSRSAARATCFACCLLVLWSAASAQAEAPEPAAAARERDPMGDLGLTFRLGYSHQNDGVIDNPAYNARLAEAAAMLPQATLESSGLVGGGGCSIIDERCRTRSRSGLLLAATLHFGGDGFGWDVEPYLMSASSALALGVYTGPKFDIHLANPVYFGFGFGLKVAYVWADGWEHAADIGGRIPVRVTYYLLEHLALVVEGSFGAGVSGYLNEKQQITDPRNGQPLGTVPKMSFGAARVWDLSVGVRFP
jgi:hypothetical protein